MQRVKAEKMRAKKACQEEAEQDDPDTRNQITDGQSSSVPQTAEESSPLAGPSTSRAVNQPEDVSFQDDNHYGGDQSSLDDWY